MAELSAKTLIRKYTAAYGLDPLDDLRRRRLDKAKQRLADQTVPISEVAASCGFSSQANFYNYFPRHTGMSPTTFRAGGAHDA